MHGLNKVAGAPGADVGDAGTILHLGGHLANQTFDGVVGLAGTARHHAWPLQGPFGTAGHAHADVTKTLTFQLSHPSFGVCEE